MKELLDTGQSQKAAPKEALQQQFFAEQLFNSKLSYCNTLLFKESSGLSYSLCKLLFL